MDAVTYGHSRLRMTSLQRAFYDETKDIEVPLVQTMQQLEQY